MPNIHERKVPDSGTKDAVNYWAVKSRESMQLARYFMDQGNLTKASELSLRAAKEADEFQNAMQAHLWELEAKDD